MTEFPDTEIKKRFDLEERTAVFGEEVITFCRMIKQDAITSPLINQIVRSSTSIGANYCEANNASSKKDFRNKIFISKKESEETKYWLRLLAKSFPEKKEAIRKLWKECHELTLIFQKIVSTIDKKNQKGTPV